MPKKTSRKKLRKKKFNLKFFLFLLPILFLFGIGIWYQSRAIPDLDEQHQVTVLPSEFRYVLGTTTAIGGQQETQVRIPIFLYHYVEYVHDDPGRQNLNIPPDVLTSQIETLKNAGYTFITPDDLTPALIKKSNLPKKLAMLTFDDGYMDFYTDVFPILQKEKVRAVAYIVPDFLDRPNYLFTYQLKEVAKSPYVEIGAHTMDHMWLRGQAQETVKYQVAQSRKTLQDLLHLQVNSFAYPYGAFDQQAIDAVTSAGFTNAISTIPGIVQTQQNKYFLYRLRPGYRSGQELLKFLTQDTFKPW